MHNICTNRRLTGASKGKYMFILVINFTWIGRPGVALECTEACEPRGHTPTFCDELEGRCSSCSLAICKTVPSIPSECICFCVTGYTVRRYSERDMRVCQHISGDAGSDVQGRPGVALECTEACEPSGHIPTFCDEHEGRCSSCSLAVCKTFPSIPSECICLCVTRYPMGRYSERDMRVCQLFPGDAESATQDDAQNQRDQGKDTDYWRPAFLIVVPALSIFILCLLMKRNHKCTRIWEMLRKQTRSINDGGDELQMLGATAPLGPEYTQARHRPVETFDLPAPGAPFRHPIQEERLTRKYTDDDMTAEMQSKAMAKEEGEDATDPGGLRHHHATETGPKHPENGVPADYIN